MIHPGMNPVHLLRLWDAEPGVQSRIQAQLLRTAQMNRSRGTCLRAHRLQIAPGLLDPRDMAPGRAAQARSSDRDGRTASCDADRHRRSRREHASQEQGAARDRSLGPADGREGRNRRRSHSQPRSTPKASLEADRGPASSIPQQLPSAEGAAPSATVFEGEELSPEDEQARRRHRVRENLRKKQERTRGRHEGMPQPPHSAEPGEILVPPPPPPGSPGSLEMPAAEPPLLAGEETYARPLSAGRSLRRPASPMGGLRGTPPSPRPAHRLAPTPAEPHHSTRFTDPPGIDSPLAGASTARTPFRSARSPPQAPFAPPHPSSFPPFSPARSDAPLPSTRPPWHSESSAVYSGAYQHYDFPGVVPPVPVAPGYGQSSAYAAQAQSGTPTWQIAACITATMAMLGQPEWMSKSAEEKYDVHAKLNGKTSSSGSGHPPLAGWLGRLELPNAEVPQDPEQLWLTIMANRKDELLLRRKLMGQCATRGVHASWFKGENLIYAPAYDPAASIQVEDPHGADIPPVAVDGVVDPREPLHVDLPMRLPVPAFAFEAWNDSLADGTKVETLPDRTPEPDLHDAGSELSWSQDPAVEAAQKPLDGMSPIPTRTGGGPPPAPPHPNIQGSVSSRMARSASAGSLRFPATSEGCKDPESGNDWCILQKDGSFGKACFSLRQLRQQARDEHIAWGIIVVRQRDNLWLKLDFDPVTVNSLCWDGVRAINTRAQQGPTSQPNRSPSALFRLKGMPEASLQRPKDEPAASQSSEASIQSWFEEASTQMAAVKANAMHAVDQDDSGSDTSDDPIEAGLQDLIDPWALDPTAGAASDAEDALDTAHAAEDEPAALAEEVKPSPQRHLTVPKPPPHVGAMLRGRLFLGVFDPQIAKSKLIKPIFDECLERVYAEAERQWKREAEQREAAKAAKAAAEEQAAQAEKHRREAAARAQADQEAEKERQRSQEAARQKAEAAAAKQRQAAEAAKPKVPRSRKQPSSDPSTQTAAVELPPATAGAQPAGKAGLGGSHATDPAAHSNAAQGSMKSPADRKPQASDQAIPEAELRCGQQTSRGRGRGRGRSTGRKAGDRARSHVSLTSLSTDPFMSDANPQDADEVELEGAPSKDSLPEPAEAPVKAAADVAVQAVQKYEDEVLKIFADTWKSLTRYDNSNLKKTFAEPVTDIEGYEEEIEHPMDLNTIGSKISVESGRVRQPNQYSLSLEGLAAFGADVQLIVVNCLQFNSSPADEAYRVFAKKLKKQAGIIFKASQDKLQKAAERRDKKLLS
ncbi:hypothetical protein WJX84_001956 [Apatococcus fuscideae]|uniref:Bromo domain-containing protein n=1 Tax=Apatococcus fuscideae TaxID=2026836 RepID=A0AAW1TC88_9CHLO